MVVFPTATKNPEMWSLYTNQRKRVTKEITNSIQDHYKALINESNGDPKKTWKTINRVLEKDVKSTNLSAIESEGKTLTKEYDMLMRLLTVTLFQLDLILQNRFGPTLKMTA